MSRAGPKPATMADVLRAVVVLYAQAGALRTDPSDPATGIEIQIGERYIGEEGAPPRIRFEPMSSPGNLGGPIDINSRTSASVTETVICRVWGAETADDESRYDDALAIAMELIDALKVVAPARLTGGTLLRDTETHIDTFGEQYVLEYSYQWAVPFSERMRAAAVALAAADGSIVGSPDPDRPAGPTTNVFSISVVNANTRP